jgi:transposase
MISNIEVTKHAHISRRKYDTIYRCFVEDISKIVNVNRYYKLFRSIILSSAIEERLEVNLHNGIEIDESYFGPTKVRGKRGRGTGSKILVFGLFKRGDKIYTGIVNSAKSKELLPIIKKLVGTG